MARPNRSVERREELLPLVARAFAELGYRRTTTAELARRCGVRENILYRLWRDKRAMFIAAIDYVYENSTRTWEALLKSDEPAGRTAAENVLAYESEHHGEFGLYRIVFAGLSETDDSEIKTALRRMYQRFAQFITAQVRSHHASGRRKRLEVTPELAAWAIIGLGTVANICREVGTLSPKEREELIAGAGNALLAITDAR